MVLVGESGCVVGEFDCVGGVFCLLDDKIVGGGGGC